MTPSERASLRSALLVTAGIYAALFAGLAIWNPLAERGARLPSELRVVILSAGSTGLSEGATGASPAARTVKPAAALATAEAPPDVPNNRAPAPELVAAAQRAGSVPVPKPAADLATTINPEQSRLARVGAGSASSGADVAPGASGGNGRSAAAADAASGADAGGSAGVAPLLALLEQRITDARVYPQAARRRNIEGSVRLRASVAADGRLVGANVVGSSGSSILDDAGVALVRRVFPIPNDLGHGFTVEVTITYRLDDPGAGE